jgi:hypothetical protein
LAEGLTGLLYPYNDISAFCNQVTRLLDEPDLGAELGHAAHEAVLPFSLDRVLPIVMEQYLSLLPQTIDPAVLPV